MACASEGTAVLYVEPFLPRSMLMAAGDSPMVNTLATIAPPLGFRFVQMGAGTELDEEAVSNPRDTWIVGAVSSEFDEDATEAGIKRSWIRGS